MFSDRQPVPHAQHNQHRPGNAGGKRALEFQRHLAVEIHHTARSARLDPLIGKPPIGGKRLRQFTRKSGVRGAVSGRDRNGGIRLHRLADAVVAARTIGRGVLGKYGAGFSWLIL